MQRQTLYKVTAALTLLAALPLLAAEMLGVKTGLWETTTTMQMGGLALPADALANLPPAQRAQMEKAFKDMGASGPSTHTSRSCVTEKDLQDGAFRQQGENSMPDCKYKQVSNSAKHQEMTFQCGAQAGNASGKMIIDATDSTHVRGTMETKSAMGNMNMKFDAKFISATCPKAGAE